MTYQSAILGGMAEHFYNLILCAEELGVSRQRASQLFHADQLPPPDAFVGGAPLWEVLSFNAFADERREALAVTPNGSAPSTFRSR